MTANTETIDELKIKALEATRACPDGCCDYPHMRMEDGYGGRIMPSPGQCSHECHEKSKHELCNGTGRVPILGDELRVKCKRCKGGGTWHDFTSTSTIDQICFICEQRGWTPSGDMVAWMKATTKLADDVEIALEYAKNVQAGVWLWYALIQWNGARSKFVAEAADPLEAVSLVIYQAVEAKTKEGE